MDEWERMNMTLTKWSIFSWKVVFQVQLITKSMLVGSMVISASIAGLSVYFFVQLFTRRICAEIMSSPMVGHRWSCLSVCVCLMLEYVGYPLGNVYIAI